MINVSELVFFSVLLLKGVLSKIRILALIINAIYADRLWIVGKTLAYTSCKFTNMKDEIVARGSHTKFVAVAWKDEKNITDELKPEQPEGRDESRSLKLPPGA